jgi:hypothetical protein
MRRAAETLETEMLETEPLGTQAAGRSASVILFGLGSVVLWRKSDG